MAKKTAKKWGKIFSSKRLLSELFELIQRLERKPKAIDLNSANGVCSYNTYKNEFGSLRNALELAGYKSADYKNLTKKKLIEYLQRFYFEFKRSPTAKDLKVQKAYPSYRQYQYKFGSLNIALKKAGLQISKHENVLDKIYLLKLRAIAKKLGRIPCAKDLSIKNNTPHYDSYRRRWGSLENALKAAGLRINVKMNWTHEELLTAIDDFYLKNRRLPISKESQITKGFPSLTVFRRVFGGFNNAIKAWRKESGIEMNISSVRRINSSHLPSNNKTKNYLMKIINEAIKKNKGNPISEKNLAAYGLPPVSIFRRVFGSWNKALLAANVPLMKISIYEKENLIKILMKIQKEKGRTPRVTDLGGKYPSYPSFQQHFGTWEAALASIGLKMSEGIYGKRARLWEKKCEEIATVFYKSPIFQKSFKSIGRPDIYIPAKKLIIDAKLTSYDIKDKTKPQISKYLKVCERIEFWCVHKTEEASYESVRYVYAKDLIKRLIRNNHFELAQSLKNFLLETDDARSEFGYLTKEDVIKAFKKFYENHKRTPTIKEFDLLVNTPAVTTVRKLFGTYNKAALAAGLEPNKSGLNYKLSGKEIIKKIKIFYEINKRVPIISELKIPIGSIKREFGCFQNALKIAGLRANKNNYSDTEIANELLKLKGNVTEENLKKIISEHKALPRWNTLVRKMGSVENLYIILGLEYKYKAEWSKEEVIKIFSQVYKTIGYIPSSKQWAKIKTKSMPSDKAIFRLFGTWKKAWSHIKI